MNEPATAICTWFVSDADADATFFPQIGTTSNTPEAQAIYWRCVACFYASSVTVNPGRRHLFFTNAALPVIEGVSLTEAFEQWGVETVSLPITFRLPQGEVSSWGNQFYVLDIIAWIATHGRANRYLVLDSDCLWLRSAEAIETAIDRDGVLTYTLDNAEHPVDEAINGLSRQGMARFVEAMGGPRRERAEYFGGELFAATREATVQIAADVPRLWAATRAGGQDAPREEAHFLSIVYALHGYREGTANPFIRRIWTTLRRHNASASDRGLTIWHLPAAKLFGFRALFARLAGADGDYRDPVRLGFERATYEALMGVPRMGAGLAWTVLHHKLAGRMRQALRLDRR